MTLTAIHSYSPARNGKRRGPTKRGKRRRIGGRLESLSDLIPRALARKEGLRNTKAPAIEVRVQEPRRHLVGPRRPDYAAYRIVDIDAAQFTDPFVVSTPLDRDIGLTEDSEKLVVGRLLE